MGCASAGCTAEGAASRKGMRLLLMQGLGVPDRQPQLSLSSAVCPGGAQQLPRPREALRHCAPSSTLLPCPVPPCPAPLVCLQLLEAMSAPTSEALQQQVASLQSMLQLER